MAVKVVDASALAAILFDEPNASEIARQMAGASLTAPSLLSLEVANICATRARREPAKMASLRALFGRRLALRIKEVDVEAEDALGLALRTGLTAYDASYLRLARSMSAELVTLDQKLARAAAS